MAHIRRSRPAATGLLSAALVCLAATAAIARAAPAPPAKSAVLPRRPEGLAEIERRWGARRAALAKSDLAGARAELDAIVQLRLDFGISSLEPHAIVLLREAREAVHVQDPRRALELVAQAQRLAPT